MHSGGSLQSGFTAERIEVIFKMMIVKKYQLMSHSLEPGFIGHWISCMHFFSGQHCRLSGCRLKVPTHDQTYPQACCAANKFDRQTWILIDIVYFSCLTRISGRC